MADQDLDLELVDAFDLFWARLERLGEAGQPVNLPDYSRNHPSDIVPVSEERYACALARFRIAFRDRELEAFRKDQGIKGSLLPNSFWSDSNYMRAQRSFYVREIYNDQSFVAEFRDLNNVVPLVDRLAFVSWLERNYPTRYFTLSETIPFYSAATRLVAVKGWPDDVSDSRRWLAAKLAQGAFDGFAWLYSLPYDDSKTAFDEAARQAEPLTSALIAAGELANVFDRYINPSLRLDRALGEPDPNAVYFEIIRIDECRLDEFISDWRQSHSGESHWSTSLEPKFGQQSSIHVQGGSPERAQSVKPVSEAEAKDWYETRVSQHPSDSNPPSRDADYQAGIDQFGKLPSGNARLSMNRIKALRSEHAPDHWKSQGRRKAQ